MVTCSLFVFIFLDLLHHLYTLWMKRTWRFIRSSASMTPQCSFCSKNPRCSYATLLNRWSPHNPFRVSIWPLETVKILQQKRKPTVTDPSDRRPEISRLTCRNNLSTLSNFDLCASFSSIFSYTRHCGHGNSFFSFVSMHFQCGYLVYDFFVKNNICTHVGRRSRIIRILENFVRHFSSLQVAGSSWQRTVNRKLFICKK